MQQARYCDDLNQLIDVARSAVQAFASPLADEEIVKTARSAWRYQSEGRNWVGCGKPPPPPAEPDGLLWTHPDAFLLWKVLRHHNEQRGRFYIANAMSRSMPVRGWPRKRFAVARKVLLCEGLIVEVLPAGAKAGAALYAWSNDTR